MSGLNVDIDHLSGNLLVDRVSFIKPYILISSSSSSRTRCPFRLPTFQSLCFNLPVILHALNCLLYMTAASCLRFAQYSRWLKILSLQRDWPLMAMTRYAEVGKKQ